MEGFSIIAGTHGHRLLEDDRPMIDVFVNEMDTHPCEGDAVLNSGLDRMGTRKGRKQGRVHIDDGVWEPFHRDRSQDAHEPRENERARARCLRCLTQRRSELVS